LSYKALDAIKESPDSLKLINGIKGWLFNLLKKDENMQKIARDMCVLFLDYVKDKDKNLYKEIGEELGKWLSDGVNTSLEISEDNCKKLAQAFFMRITMTQLLSLKQYAAPSLLKLISRGGEVDNLAAVIVDLKNPELTKQLFDTLKSLEKEKKYTPDDKYMRALYKIYTEEAGVYIVDLILNKRLTLENNKDDLAYAFETALKMSTELNSAAIRRTRLFG
jgi:hypothetical protein